MSIINLINLKMIFSKNILFIYIFIFINTTLFPNEKELKQNKTNSKSIVVACTNYPIYFFSKKLTSNTKGKYKIEFIIDRDVDPPFWDPSDDDLIKFSNSNIILENGAGYSKWMKNVSLPNSKIFDTSTNFKFSFIKVKGISHSHGKSAKVHSHSGIAYTTWTDFSQAIQQVNYIAELFIKKAPEYSNAIKEEQKELVDKLSNINSKMKDIGEKFKDIKFMASHPVYNYMARAYKIKIKSFVLEPDKKITKKELKKIKRTIKSYFSKVMIWEGSPIEENVKMMELIGVQNFVFDPCANFPDEGDFFDVMEKNINNFINLNLD